MKRLNEIEIRNIYDKYVNSQFLYRAMSTEYLQDVKKHGLTPHKNPFEKFKKEIRKFLNLILYLDKKGYKISYAWHNEIPPIEKLVRVLRTDLKRKNILFGPDLNEIKKYYIKRKGGSMICTISEISELIKRKRYPLNKKQEKFLNEMINWCKQKRKFKMFIVKISRTSQYLENAKFQHFGGKYWPSPFGSFNHFKKVIIKEGWREKYATRLEENKIFYLHLNKPVPPKEIKIIK